MVHTGDTTVTTTTNASIAIGKHPVASKDVGKVTSLEKENKKLQNQVAKLKREITKLNKVLRKHVSTINKQKRNIVQLKEKCSIA